jgi:uncharacterized membrane protein (UPF0127 family)
MRNIVQTKLLFTTLSIAILVISIGVWISASSSQKASSPPSILSPLSIHTQDGKTHGFMVELATSAEQKKQGLMFRETLPTKQGMLFIHNESQEIIMWMKNTLIPLDILFIDQHHRIVHIEKNTVPESLTLLRSKKPSVAVLEVNAGIVEKHAIQVGDSVLHSALSIDN